MAANGFWDWTGTAGGLRNRVFHASPQFTLRALFVLVAVLSMAFRSLLSWHQNANALRSLEREGAFVTVGTEPTCHESPTPAEQNLVERIAGPESVRYCLNVLGVPRRTRVSFVGRPFPSGCVAILGELSRLESFSMDGFLALDASFGDRDLLEVARISSLRSFSLQANGVVTDEGIRCLNNAQYLEYVMLVDCPRITGRGLVSLATLHNLRTLFLGRLDSGDSLPSALQNKLKLERLTLLDMDIGPKDLEVIASLPRLRCLSLTSCRFDRRAITALSAARAIRELDLRYTDVTDAELPFLARIKTLDKVLLGHD